MSGPAARWYRGVRSRADAFLFGSEAAGRVRATRALLAVVVGLRVALGPYRELVGQPAALFRPPWYLSWLDAMPPVEIIVGVQVVGALAAVLVVVGWRERATFALAWASLLVLGGLRASRGKFLHNDVLLLLVCIAFLLAPVGLRWLDRRRGRTYGWPVRTALAVVAIVYFLTGAQKLVTSGPAWVTSDNLRNVMYAAPISGRAPTDAVALFVADRPWLTHVLAAATLAIELGFLAILVWPRVRPFFVVAAVALHGSIWLTHGLDYLPWVAVVSVVLIDWSEVVERIRRRRPRPRAPAPLRG